MNGPESNTGFPQSPEFAMIETAARGRIVTTLLAGTLAITAASIAIGPAADAAKGGKNATARTTAIVLNQSAPKLGDVITFSAVYPSTARNPRIQVVCTQNGVTTYGEAASPSDAFVLGGGWSVWLQNGGPASCKADLFDAWSTNTGQETAWFGSTTFEAGG